MLTGSPSSVLTLGLGSWGSASLIVTAGFGTSAGGEGVGPSVFGFIEGAATSPIMVYGAWTSPQRVQGAATEPMELKDQ